MEEIIVINNLNYLDILSNFNIMIKKNKISTISGPNNCGKTTLMRILSKEIFTEQNILINNKNINEYKLNEYQNIVQIVIPNEIIFIEDTLEEELLYHCKLNDKEKENLIVKVVKELKIKKILTKNIKTLTKKETILSQLAIALISLPKILLLDNIGVYFNEKEYKEIILLLNNMKISYDMTIIMTTINLKESLSTDYLYIINEGKIELEGQPIEVLQKDNIINKIGLNLPFMIDLSVKLKDYDLVNNIELDYDRMVEKLWK